jgi:dCTP deaminase
MFLSDKDILDAVNSNAITLKDFDRSRLQVASYDVLLGNKFIITEKHSTPIVDPVNKIFAKTREIIIEDGEQFILHPNETVLGEVADFVGSDEYLIQIGGKSSLARIGLIVHNTAGVVNPGHFLNIVLELANLSQIPIILRPKMEIAQLLFSQMSSKPLKSYKETGRYNSDNWDSFQTKK